MSETQSTTTDQDVIRTAKVQTGGGDVNVHTPRFECFCEVMDFVEKEKLQFPPAMLGLDWLGLHEENAEKAVDLKRRNEEARTTAIMNWIFGTRKVIPIIIRGVTTLNDEQIAKLGIDDVILIVGQGLALVNLERTIEQVTAFFPASGGLTQILDAMKGAMSAQGPAAVESSDGTTGPSKS